MDRWNRILARLRRYADLAAGPAPPGRDPGGPAPAGRGGAPLPGPGAGPPPGDLRAVPVPFIDGGDEPTVGLGGGAADHEPAPASGWHDEVVPRPLRVAASYSWRLLLIAAASLVVLWVIGKLKLVFIPLAIALLLSALLWPPAKWLRDRAGLHRSFSAAIMLIGGVLAVLGTLTLVITQFVSGFPDLQRNAFTGVKQIQMWLRTGPLHLSDQQIDSAIAAAQKWLDTHRDTLTTGAVSTASTIAEIAAGTFLVLFTTFFFLRDGRRIWYFVVGVLPGQARWRVAAAGESAWQTLVAYVRATVLVAFIDASGIGLALAALRVEFAFSLAALVFLGAFIPIVGATLSGAVAVLVALVTRGVLYALIVLACVIGIQQLEGHLLQPLIMGRAVAIHPLAVIVAIATGAVLGGIVGALVAVPTVAVLNTGVRHLIANREGRPPPPPPHSVVIRD